MSNLMIRTLALSGGIDLEISCKIDQIIATFCCHLYADEGGSEAYALSIVLRGPLRRIYLSKYEC